MVMYVVISHPADVNIHYSTKHVFKKENKAIYSSCRWCWLIEHLMWCTLKHRIKEADPEEWLVFGGWWAIFLFYYTDKNSE